MAPSTRQRPWISLGLSAALHAALIALTIQLARKPPEPAPDGRRGAVDPARQVEMIYLPPPPPASPPPPTPAPTPPPQPPPPAPTPAPSPTAPPERTAPPPDQEQRTPEPDANATPDAPRTRGEEPTRDAPPGGDPTGAPDVKNGSPAPADNAATMESEARRIFGSPRLGTWPGVGPRASRPMEAYLPDHPEKCSPKPSAPPDPSAAPQFGIVTGKIFRRDNGRPLSGAHLQMLGTPYVAFTDDGGEYHFRFDLALVDNCRTQYVRVIAPGYESRLLVLMVGPNVRSDDVLLKRR